MDSLRRVVLSRTDALGDVVLTLPMAGWIKRHWPDTEVIFLANAYARPVLEVSRHVDRVLDRSAVAQDLSLLADLDAEALIHVSPDPAVATLAQQARIPLRIGTSHRPYHLLRCNRLVNLSRQDSHLHEAQLNLRLLAPLGFDCDLSLDQIQDLYGMENVTPLEIEDDHSQTASTGSIAGKDDEALGHRPYRLVLHPRSSGSAREWPLDHYLELARQLDRTRFRVYVTGMASEGDQMRDRCPALFDLPHVTDITGRYSLPEFIRFLAGIDGLVAASTGPLHIASALGRHVAGLYPPLRPMHPGRWGPVGSYASYFVRDAKCSACRRSRQCACMGEIAHGAVASLVESWAAAER